MSEAEPRTDEPEANEPEKSAVVLSGGGADGAYEVGVLKALMSGESRACGYQPFEPDVFAGTSAGAFNVSYLVSHWDEYGTAVVANLERVWLERLCAMSFGTGTGFYRYRANPLSLFDPRAYLPNPFMPMLRMAEDSASLFWEGLQRGVGMFTATDEPFAQRLVRLFNFSSFVSRQPWEHRLQEEINYEGILRSDKILKIAATNWANGTLTIFNNSDMTPDLGPKAILASSALPGFFSPTEYGAQPFIDGAVLLNTPLKPAIRAGATTIHVVYLDPDIQRIPVPQLNTLETFYRMQQIGWAAAYNDDIADAGHINQALAILKRLDRGEDVSSDREFKDLLRRAGSLRDRFEMGLRYKELTIHRHHPRDDLGGALGPINADRDRLARLVDRGFRDTVHHDCEVAGCILPEGAEEPAAREGSSA